MSATLHRTEALKAAQRAINSMKQEAETAAMLDEPAMLEALERISNEGLAADTAIRAALSAVSDWQPIETAPKDGTKVLVYCPRLGVCGPAHWDVNKFAKKPRPFWTHWGERIWGTTWVRDDKPTFWQPLPLPPSPNQGEAS